MSLNPKDKMINGERMEKWILRKAFEEYPSLIRPDSNEQIPCDIISQRIAPRCNLISNFNFVVMFAQNYLKHNFARPNIMIFILCNCKTF